MRTLISTGTRTAPRRTFRARISRRAGRARLKCPASVGDVKLATLEDDGARVWIDGKLVIDAWGPHASTTSEATAVLTAGVPHQIRIEYLQLDFGAQHQVAMAVGPITTRATASRGFRRATGLTPGRAKPFPVPATVTNDGAARRNSDLDQIGCGSAARAGDAIHRRETVESHHAGFVSARRLKPTRQSLRR